MFYKVQISCSSRLIDNVKFAFIFTVFICISCLVTLVNDKYLFLDYLV